MLINRTLSSTLRKREVERYGEKKRDRAVFNGNVDFLPLKPTDKLTRHDLQSTKNKNKQNKSSPVKYNDASVVFCSISWCRPYSPVVSLR